MHVSLFVCESSRARARVCVRACVRAYMRACVRLCVNVVRRVCDCVKHSSPSSNPNFLDRYSLKSEHVDIVFMV